MVIGTKKTVFNKIWVKKTVKLSQNVLKTNQKN